MRKLLTILFLSFLSFSAVAQQQAQPVFAYVEQMPEAGFDMNAYLSKNIQYPKDAMKEGVEGRVVVKFVVTATGQISDVQVVRGIYPSIDAEAVRVVKGMPAWKPGKQNGVPVAVYYNLPISFRLENNSPADKTAGDKKK